jgi:predicted nucleotidyltransferase component of viral defense system
MSASVTNVAASVRQRLANLAKERGEDFEQVLVRYALERLLYRLSVSKHAENFVLKGALLFRLWFDLEQRPTRDIDFLGFGAADTEAAKKVFSELVATKVDHDDGLVFIGDSVTAEEIRKDAGYPGVRVTMQAELARARIPVQCDIGFGDVITPKPLRQNYPTLLDMPSPSLHVYPLETVVAEKLEALVKLAAFNSRLKDYFDLWVLMRFESIDKSLLPKAIGATFARRATAHPEALPAGLTDEFAKSKNTMWMAFLRRSGLDAPQLGEVVGQLREFYWPLLRSAAKKSTK